MILFALSANVAAQELNKLDSNGKRDGSWKGKYDESQRLRYEGTFDHGKETGVFKFYDDTKENKLLATRDFTGKDGSVYIVFFNQKGSKVSEGKVVDKEFEGEWKYYHENSPKIMTREFYKNGKLNGNRTVYFISGNIAEVVNYIDGQKDGVYKKTLDNGIVVEEDIYANGELNGLATFRDPSGKVTATGKYKDGKRKGKWQFFEDGKPMPSDNTFKMKVPEKVPRKIKLNK